MQKLATIIQQLLAACCSSRNAACLIACYFSLVLPVLLNLLYHQRNSFSLCQSACEVNTVPLHVCDSAAAVTGTPSTTCIPVPPGT